jgi:23S rRNA-/tRNA-specific pseudouridylate synthase
MKRNRLLNKSMYYYSSSYSTTTNILNLTSDIIRIDDRLNDINYNKNRAKILLNWLNNSINKNIKAYKENYKNDLIYYENDQYIVINKPYDLLIDRNINDNKRPLSLENLIVKIRPHLKIPLKFCHQIDYQTSGVLLIAKSKQSAAIACQSFYDKTVTKSYVALVVGINII